MLGLNTPLERAPHPIEASVEGMLVMLDPERGKYYELNRIASRIWQLLAQPMTLAQIVAVLKQEFETTPDICMAETQAFVETMLEMGIVRLA